MDQKNNQEWNQFLQNLPDINWGLIIFGFFLGTVPGVVLLILKLMKESVRTPNGFERYEQLRRDRGGVIEYTQENRSTRGTSAGVNTAAGYSAPLRQTSSSQRRAKLEEEQEQQDEPEKKRRTRRKKGIGQFPYKPIKTGRGLMITGGVIAGVFALAIGGILSDWGFNPQYFSQMLKDLIVPAMFFGAGAGTFLCGLFRRKKARKFKQYLARMENAPLIPLRPLAESLCASMDEVCQTLQDMIDDGLFGERAYLDIGAEMLVIDASVAKPDPAQRPAAEEKKTDSLDFTAEDQILRQIRSANDRIPGEEISGKIDRIEEITRHILTYLKKHPERSGELHTFLDYYLPTTLKMLNTYAELDAQRMDGENIAATKRRIEGILDKVVEGFELQLDKLFEGDMLDITSDIDVMEKMLQRDGLSGDTKLTARSFDNRAQQGYTPTLTLDPNGGSAAAVQSEE